MSKVFELKVTKYCSDGSLERSYFQATDCSDVCQCELNENMLNGYRYFTHCTVEDTDDYFKVNETSIYRVTALENGNV